MFLVWGFLVRVAGGEHHALDAQVHHFVEEGAHRLRIGAIEQRGVGGDAETALEGFFDASHGEVISTFAAHGEIMFFAAAVEVYAEGEIFAGLEEINFLFQQQRVGAEIDVFLAGDQALDDLGDPGMHERLAAGDGNHGRATLIHSAEAFLGRELFLEDVGGILDLAASGASQVAAKQRLQHEHERILLAPRKFLAQYVRRDRPHLRHGYGHF